MRLKAKIALIATSLLVVSGTAPSALAMQSADRSCELEVIAYCQGFEQAGYPTQSACYYEQLTLACPGPNTNPGNPPSPTYPGYPGIPYDNGGNTRYCQGRVSCDVPRTPEQPTNEG